MRLSAKSSVDCFPCAFDAGTDAHVALSVQAAARRVLRLEGIPASAGMTARGGVQNYNNTVVKPVNYVCGDYNEPGNHEH